MPEQLCRPGPLATANGCSLRRWAALALLVIVSCTCGRAGAANTTSDNTTSNLIRWDASFAPGLPDQPWNLTLVPGDLHFASLAAGYSSCGLVANGSAFCFSEDNNTTDAFDASSDKLTTLVEPVPGGLKFVSLASGGSSTCGLLASGLAYCFGNGESGQLGNGSRESSSTPLAAMPTRQFSALCAGDDFACGVDSSTSGAVCWGANSRGQLGSGNPTNTSDSLEGVQVVGGLLFAPTLACGKDFVCAVTAPNGTAGNDTYCWGNNALRQLGSGSDLSESFRPLLLLGGHHFSQISCGDEHCCALEGPPDQTGGMQAFCWGSSSYGQLGFGEMGNPGAPVAVTGGHSFISITAGREETFGVLPNGTGMAWGLNTQGSLGIGETPSINVPTPQPIQGNYSFKYIGRGYGLLRTGDEGPEMPPTTPTPTPPSASSSSSSTPIGAIIGGVVGGIVVLAILAFLALRPGKGWLRRRRAGGAKSTADKEARLDGKLLNAMPQQLAPAQPPFSVGVVSSGDTHGQFSPVPVPASYLTTAGVGHGDGTARLQLMAADPLLSAISTGLAAARRAVPEAQGGSEVSAAELREWMVRWEDLQLERPLGRGSFGKVYLARWAETPCAVKVLLTTDMVEQGELQLPPRVLHDLQEEASVMVHMRHPNLLNFLGLCTLPPCLLTEYCSRGSLYDVLQAASRQPEAAAALTWRLRLQMACDATTGLLYLHRRSIVHRDIKSPNLLVDDSWRIKLADFNLSKILVAEQPANAPPTAGGPTNPLWLAPEILRGGKASPASDTFALGLVMWEMLTWRLPWADQQPLQPFRIARLVMNGSRPAIPPQSELPGPDIGRFASSGLDVYCQLIRECWAQDPADRPSLADVVPRLRALLERLER